MDGVSKDRQVALNNRLALYQDKRVCAPRAMDWSVLTELGIAGKIEDMFRVRYVQEDVLFETMAWRRVLDVKQKVYRELCLEIFCSLEVDEEWTVLEVATKEIVQFRLGGKPIQCTLPQFGVWAGIYTPEEVAEPGFAEYLARGEIHYGVTASFDMDSYWREITRKDERFNRKQSKVVDIWFPILRVIHKMLVYYLFHRSTHTDKVYVQELWGLWLFQHRHKGGYMNLAWVLACHLESNGAGHRSESQICGVHYVTRIMRALQLFSPVATQDCSAPVPMRLIDMTILRAAKLINKNTGRLLGTGEVPPPVIQRRRVDLQAVGQELLQVRESQHVIMSQLAVILYEHRRYQQVLERLAQDSIRASGVVLADYVPPEIFVPAAPQPEEEPAGEGAEDDQAAGREVEVDDEVEPVDVPSAGV